MRRSSTAFSLPGLPGRAGSATPPPPDSDTASIAGSVSSKHEREDSSPSLNKLLTTSPPAVSTPSPIPESPAREAAALTAEPLPAPTKEPSPLSGQVVTADSAPATSAEEPPAPQPAPNDTQPPSEPFGSTEPKPSQPNPSVVVEDASASAPEIAPVFTDEPEEIPVAPQSSPPSAPASVPVSKPSTPPARVPTAPSAPVTPPAKPVTSSGYFDISRRASATAEIENVSNVWANNSTENVSSPQGQRIVSQKQSLSSLGRPGSSVSNSVGAPALQSRKASRGSFQPRERDIAGSTYTWSNSSGIGFKPTGGIEDPFADPKAAVQPQPQNVIPAQAVAAVSPAETIHVPEPFDPRSPRDETMVPAAEPAALALPPMHEVISSQPSRQPSGYNLGASASDPMDYFGRSQDERRPLLTSSRPSTPPIITTFHGHTTSSSAARPYHSSGIAHPTVVAQPTPQWARPARFDVNGSARNNYDYGSVRRPYADSGWYEYVLPHGIRYFGNPEKRATTDLDLRSHARLEEVERVMESAMENVAERQVPDGCEMWIRRSHKVSGWSRKKGATMGDLVVFWVDHRYRRILTDVPNDDGAVSGEDDRLDDEYRYWSYVEMHPAHVVLSQASRQEAADALHWSYTDRLLAHAQPIQPPFSQEECQELLRLLNDPSQQSTLSYTRMVARVLLRAAHWRQVNFRPHKPLPRDIIVAHTPRQTPMLRTTVEILIGILCLGIPFLFVDRARYSGHFDVEGNASTQSSAPLFVVGACTCLVSAIILSASVTLISFPGLDSIARIGGLVAISCSVLSMVTSFLSIFRYKAEMAQGSAAVHHAAAAAREGFVFLPRRSILLSLPLVFLAYSVAGFITGVVVYSFRTATINFAHAGMPAVAIKFDEYARWMVVGVLGALTGVLIASVVVSRR